MSTDKNKFTRFLYRFRREFLIFSLLLFTLLSTLPAELHGWNSIWYAMDYSLGMDSRLFIGSLLKPFYPQFLPAEAVYTFVLLSLILFLAVLSYILGSALRRIGKTDAEKGLLVLILLYLLCPGSPAYLWSTENMGRFDLYLLLFTLFAAVIFMNVASVPPRLLLFTVAGAAALCTHQVFLFIFFPLLFTMYLTSVTEEKAAVWHKILAAVCIGVLGIVFLYFQFVSHISVSSFEELSALLSARTDLPVNETALNYEYFSTISQSAGDLMLNELGERLRYGCITVFLLAPLAAVYAYLWTNIIKACGKGTRLKYLLLLLSHLCFLPAFVLTIDWGRWFGAFLTVQALQIVILAAKKDAVILTALTRLSAALHKHPFLFILCGIWLGSLHKFQATLLPDAPVFFSSAYRLLHILF